MYPNEAYLDYNYQHDRKVLSFKFVILKYTVVLIEKQLGHYVLHHKTCL